MTDKQYIRICPDYDVLYDDAEGACAYPYGDEISNEDPSLGPTFSIIVPGIEEWQQRYVRAVDFVKIENNISFDWRSWHFEGLQFAKAIWERVPRCCSVYYQPPFEDPSKTISEIKVDENIDVLIEQLGPESSFRNTKPAVRHDIDFSASRNEDSVTVYFRLGRTKCNVTFSFSQLKSLRIWLEDLASCINSTDEPIHHLNLTNIQLVLYQQTVGVHKDMGQFWVSERCGDSARFSAYVNIKDFIKGLYLVVMNKLGFHHYPISLEDDDEYPSGEERVRLWQPYNTFKSAKIENAIVNDHGYLTVGNKVPINATLVMFPDYPGGVFSDTMGVCAGDYEEIYTDLGNFKLDVPGLKEWAYDCDNPNCGKSFEFLWKRGWELALEVRKQLPDNIDLYYMCYNPRYPQNVCEYGCSLLKIIVPRTISTLFDYTCDLDT